MSEKNLVGVEGENLRLGEVTFDLDGQHRFLDLAMERPVRRQEQIACQLHGQGGRALHSAARFDVAIGCAYDAPEIDSGVAVEILVFDGDQRVAQHGRKIVIARDYPPLQREGTDHPLVIVINLGDRTGAVGFERLHLRQVGGVDQQQAGCRSDQRCDEHEQAEQDAPDQLAPADFHLGKIFVEGLHEAAKVRIALRR